MKWRRERVDYKTYSTDNYFEDIKMNGSDYEEVDNLECLWQELVGEIKTNKGEVYGINTEEYGTDIKRFLGEYTDLSAQVSIDQALEALMQKYPEIIDMKCEIKENSPGSVKLKITASTIYGNIADTIEIITREC